MTDYKDSVASYRFSLSLWFGESEILELQRPYLILLNEGV